MDKKKNEENLKGLETCRTPLNEQTIHVMEISEGEKTEKEASGYLRK